MAITENSIRNTYYRLKNKANSYLNNGNIHKALLYVHLASYTDHTFFLSYHDNELEEILKRVADRIKPSKNNNITPNKNRCVMLDSLSRYRGGLAVQYINAIASAGWELLYVTCQEIDAPQRKELKTFLNSIQGVTILEVPKHLEGLAKLQYIYDSILSYSPSKLYCHLNAYDAYFSTIAYALPKFISKFIINITDHASQLGFQSCNYSFEFRELGCSISNIHRGIESDHLLYLPFYPLIDNIPFKGLPSICKGKKIILSGGRYFKVMDKDDTFFKLVKKIIDKHPDVVVVFPGSEDDYMIKMKIKEYRLENYLILLGWRCDISELFRHADIFLNTYPHGGATMAQYAAHLHVPILSFRPEGYCANPVECFVCQDGYTEISSIGESEFLEEASRLLNDKDYARQKAEDTYSCVLGVEKFNTYFKEMSETCRNIIPFRLDPYVDIDISQRAKLIAYHNKVGEYQMRLVALSGINSITLSKTYLYPFVKKILPKFINLALKRGLHLNRF